MLEEALWKVNRLLREANIARMNWGAETMVSPVR